MSLLKEIEEKLKQTNFAYLVVIDNTVKHLIKHNMSADEMYDLIERLKKENWK